jgi:integrase
MYKVFDGGGGGLFAQVEPNGAIYWRLKATLDGKEKVYALGVFQKAGNAPLELRRAKGLSLDDARTAAREKLALLGKGIDPIAHERMEEKTRQAEEERKCRTVRIVIEEWMNSNRDVWAANTLEGHERRLHLLAPVIDLPFADVGRQELRAVLKGIEDRGFLPQAKLVASMMNAIWRYGVDCGYIDANPADGLSRTLTKRPARHMAAVTDPAEVGDVLRCVWAYRGKYAPIRIALRLLAYIGGIRSSELGHARWEEIDLDTGVWTVPATRMKARREHVVFLSRQAIELFRELREIVGGDGLCFPSSKGISECIGENSLLCALRRAGLTREEMSVHGFRSVFSTLANTYELALPHVIEAALAHGNGDRVAAAYNRADYAEQRRKLSQAYSDLLDALRLGDDGRIPDPQADGN